MDHWRSLLQQIQHRGYYYARREAEDVSSVFGLAFSPALAILSTSSSYGRQALATSVLVTSEDDTPKIKHSSH